MRDVARWALTVVVILGILWFGVFALMGFIAIGTDVERRRVGTSIAVVCVYGGAGLMAAAGAFWLRRRIGRPQPPGFEVVPQGMDAARPGHDA